MDDEYITDDIKKYTKFKRIIVSFKDKDNETIKEFPKKKDEQSEEEEEED